MAIYDYAEQSSSSTVFFDSACLWDSKIYLNRRKSNRLEGTFFIFLSIFFLFVFTIISIFMFVFFSLVHLKYFNNFSTVVKMNKIEKEKKKESKSFSFIYYITKAHFEHYYIHEREGNGQIYLTNLNFLI